MIDKILIISLFTIGYCSTFWPDMIFEKIGDWLEEHLPEWFNKPTWSCYICVCFWLGTAIYWKAWGNSIKEWLLCVIPAMGLNAVISQATKKKDAEETYKQECKPDITITVEQIKNNFEEDCKW